MTPKAKFNSICQLCYPRFGLGYGLGLGLVSGLGLGFMLGEDSCYDQGEGLHLGQM